MKSFLFTLQFFLILNCFALSEKEDPTATRLCGIFQQIQTGLELINNINAGEISEETIVGPKYTDILCAPTGACCCPEIRCYNANGSGCTAPNQCTCPCGGPPC